MMSEKSTIVDQMYSGDKFSKYLGIEIVSIEESKCKLKMIVRKDMLNGFNILHGGVCFALADTCLAFASNTKDYNCLSLNATIEYTKPAKSGDILTAESVEINVTRKIGIYDIIIKNQDAILIAVFRGSVYRIKKNV